MKPNNRHIDPNTVDLTKLDSESMDCLVSAIQNTKFYQEADRKRKVFSRIWNVVFIGLVALILMMAAG